MPMTANACSPRRRKSSLRVCGLLWVMPAIKCLRSGRAAPCNSQLNGLKAHSRPFSKPGSELQAKTGAGALEAYAR